MESGSKVKGMQWRGGGGAPPRCLDPEGVELPTRTVELEVALIDPEEHPGAGIAMGFRQGWAHVPLAGQDVEGTPPEEQLQILQVFNTGVLLQAPDGRQAVLGLQELAKLAQEALGLDLAGEQGGDHGTE